MKHYLLGMSLLAVGIGAGIAVRDGVEVPAKAAHIAAHARSQAQAQAQPLPMPHCVKADTLIAKAKEAGFGPTRIEDPNLIKAIGAELTHRFGEGHTFETETRLVLAFDLPDETTLLVEFNSQGCQLPSGGMPTSDWRAILDRVQV